MNTISLLLNGMNPLVDPYFQIGCGRCPLYNTPQCKVHTWAEPLAALRHILLQTDLKEELKWSMPTYTYGGANVCMISAFKDFASLSFFKGSLLKDPNRILVQQGANSQAARILKFTDVGQVHDLTPIIFVYLEEAIGLEKTQTKVQFLKNPEPEPEELLMIFGTDQEFQDAFYALTPGRRRGYILHFSQAKQATTRIARIVKYREKIMSGKGIMD